MLLQWAWQTGREVRKWDVMGMESRGIFHMHRCVIYMYDGGGGREPFGTITTALTLHGFTVRGSRFAVHDSPSSSYIPAQA